MIPDNFNLTVDPVAMTHTLELGENLLLAMGVLFAAVVIVRVKR